MKVVINIRDDRTDMLCALVHSLGAMRHNFLSDIKTVKEHGKRSGRNPQHVRDEVKCLRANAKVQVLLFRQVIKGVSNPTQQWLTEEFEEMSKP